MKKIIYLPLDERPCNLAYPVRLFDQLSDVSVVTPPKAILGHKKTPADVAAIRQFVEIQASQSQVLVASTELLVYGGLLPSRIYPVSENMPNAAGYQRWLTQLKQDHPKLTILVSNLIMRTPRYSSGDEEPEYYENFGAEIFRFGWLTDKKQRLGLDDKEASELAELAEKVPTADIEDYTGRRQANLAVNMANIAMVKAGVIDYLAIPQDDSAPFGYTAMDQAVVYPAIKAERLQTRIGTYPGADEAGYTLLARALQQLRNQKFSIYPEFAGVIGSMQVPLYEDRPLCESVKSHILSAGANIASSPESADLILAVNTPGKQMIEARAQLSSPDLTYDTYRNLRAFVDGISNYLKANKPVAVADSAYANGADLELLAMLDESELLPKLAAYRAWNTNCNTLGSTISAAIIQSSLKANQRRSELLNAVLDDGLYQPIVRGEVTDNWLPAHGLDYFSLSDQSAAVSEVVQAALLKEVQRYLPKTLSNVSKLTVKISFPWNRMFEINCSTTISEV